MNKKRGCLKDGINELAAHGEKRKVRYLYRSVMNVHQIMLFNNNNLWVI
jgi:GH25 family lysozyme M1 (1,4-beta-N-acetylmuramidase)